MKTLIAILVLFLIAVPASTKEKEQALVVRQDVPMGITYYVPTNVPVAKSDASQKFKFLAYVGQKANGKPSFRLVIATMCMGYCGSYLSHESVITVDGEQFVVPANALNRVEGLWTSADIGSANMDEIVRKIASGRDVWLIVVVPKGENLVRHNIHLSPEQLATFKMVVDKANALDPAASASK